MKRLFDLIRRNERLQIFLKDNRGMLIKVAAAGLLVCAAFFVFGLSGKGAEPPEIEEDILSAEETEPQETAIYVDISGEVRNPIVVELKEGSRVEDAIEAAGGVTEHADLTEINRAAFVADGDKIFIPSLIDAYAEYGEGGAVTASVYTDGKININTADSEELQQLNGVGPATAEKIMDYRETHGRFHAIEDIKNVSGIGEKTFEKFKDDIRT